ncbi:MAG: exosortase/archaeosortase family protein [Roseimicrobium sp.]
MTSLPSRPLIVASHRARVEQVLSCAIVGLALAGLIFVLPYAAGYSDYRKTIFQWLVGVWRNPTWQHGALAPPIAAFLIWRRRRTLAAMEPRPSAWGLLLCAICLVLYWGGYRGNFYYLGYASLQLVVAGVVVWLWGWQFFWRMGFAWLILGFAWPYLFLEDTLAFKLRHLMVTGTTFLLKAGGLEVLQDGTRITSAIADGVEQGALFNLNVDGPCSGLRSLFALMMVGALFGYFRQRSTWRRLLLFALSVPLAVLANMVRILVLVLASVAFGSEFAVGRGEEYTSNFHLLTGVAVFIFALGGLILSERTLNRLCGKEKPLALFED